MIESVRIRDVKDALCQSQIAGDCTGRFKNSVAVQVYKAMQQHEFSLYDVQDALRSIDEMDWEGMERWMQVSAMRDDVQTLVRAVTQRARSSSAAKLAHMKQSFVD